MSTSMSGNIKLGPNWLRVENRTLFGEGPNSAKRRFARRVFALQEVESLAIDPASGSALIRYRAEDEDAETFGARLADAVGGTSLELDDSALPVWPTDERTELRRWSGLISCLQVVQKGPREIELRHPGFAGQGRRLARRVKEMLECENGVVRASVSIKGHVRLRLSADADPEDLVKRAEKSLPAARGQHPLPAYRRVKFGAANLNMGLCAAGQFMFPAMIPLASGVLLATRLDTFREAGKQLAHGKLGVPSFQTVVVACSVATGAPLASALGEWLGCFWQRRWRRKVAEETRTLLDEAFPPAIQAVAADDNGAERNVPVSALHPGDRIRVRATELVPVDGRVLSGEALVDETAVRGTPGAMRKRPQDRVFGSSLVLAGDLLVEVEATHTTAARLAGTVAGRASAMPEDRGLRQKAAAAAERSVLPNLALAGIGMATGGLHTVSAILHQDWITGPHVAFPTQTFRDMRLAVRLGALVNSPTALSRLGETDLLIVNADMPELLASCVELDSLQSGQGDAAELLERCASVGLYLGDARTEALANACRSRGLPLHRPDAVVLGAGRTQGSIGGLNIALIDEAGESAGPLAPLTVQIDGEDAARLSFRLSAAPKASEVLASLKALGLKIVAVSQGDDRKAEALSNRLGADLAGSMNDAEMLRFLRRLKQLGHKAAYLGAAGTLAAFAAEAHVTIGLGGTAEGGTPEDISLLGDALAALPQLLELGKSQEAKVDSACKRTIVPNVLCIAGAFTGVLNGTTSTLLANVGVMSVDRRQRRLLDGKLAPA